MQAVVGRVRDFVDDLRLEDDLQGLSKIILLANVPKS